MKKSLLIVAAVVAASITQAQEKVETDSTRSTQTKIKELKTVGKKSRFKHQAVLQKALTEKQLRSAPKENAIKPDEVEK